MIRLIDNTLISLDQNLPSKEDLHIFCELLFTIGVDAVELSVPVYKQMEKLPESQKFILNLQYEDDMNRYPGFYRYVSRQEVLSEKFIYELQINDTREIVKLRALQHCKEVRIVGLDDVMCHDSYERILEEMMHWLPRSTIILSPENTYGCASAIAIQWACEFGKDITTSFAGCMKNGFTEEVLMAMRLAVRYKPNRNLTVLPQLTQLYEKITQTPVGKRKPIIGKNIFKVEAGIHVDGINKNPATYEAYTPSLVGGRFELVIGKHSSSKAIKLKLAELNIRALSDVLINQIARRVKCISTEMRRSLNDDEFVALVGEVVRNEGS